MTLKTVSIQPSALYVGDYDAGLVTLSVAIAIFAAYTALSVAQLASSTRQQSTKNILIALGGLALGVGVWGMHFVGMLGFRLPCAVTYNPLLTGLSILPGVIASLIALHVVSKPRWSSRDLWQGGLLVGAGIGLMHFTGMAAMQIDGSLAYDPVWFTLSIVTAILLAELALWIRFGVGRLQSLRRWAVPSAAVVMGSAIAAMHYTAMNATFFIRAAAPSETLVEGVAPTSLATLITVVITLLLGLIMLVVFHIVTAAIAARTQIEALARELQQRVTAIEESEMRLQALYESSSDAILIFNRQGFVHCNRRTLELFGLKEPLDLIDYRPGYLSPPIQPDGSDSATIAKAHILRAYEEGSCRFEWVLRKRDGTDFPAEIMLSAYRIGAETLLYASVRDITGRKQGEAELRASEARFRAMFEEAPLGVALIDSLDGRIYEVNPRFAEIAGRSRAEMARTDWMSITHPDDVQEDLDQMARLNAGEIPGFHLNKRYLRPDGSPVWISMTIAPLNVPGGERPRHLCLIEDITERKQVEAQLLERVALREQLGSIAQSVPGMVYSFRLRPDGTVCLPYASPRVRDIFGLAPENLAEDGQPLFDLIHPEDIGRIREQIVASAKNLTPFRAEWRILHPELGIRWLEATSNPFPEPDGAVLWHGFAHDITDRKRAELDLDEARRKALAASQAKSEFLANMSHEIRTPMNAILGLAQILEREARDADQRNLLRKISESGASLLRIINDILDFSKIEAGQLQIDPHPFGFAPLLERLETLFAPAARQKGIELCLLAPEVQDMILFGDALRLEQVLTNLLGNAIKFTHQGKVSLSILPLDIGRDNVRLRFEVEDTGIGIAPEYQASLFMPFTQAEAGTTRRFGGTGLGLSISKCLVDLMGGAIGVTSTPGQGSTFWFELPFEKSKGERPASEGQPDEIPARGPRLAGLRVLAVDDNRINLFLVDRALKLEGASVSLAADGLQALQTLKTHPQGFDVVLMDIQMPVMDGLTATRAIRDDPELAELPVIALTAGVLTQDREAALQAGVNDFLAKPLDLQQMNELLALYLNIVAKEATATDESLKPAV